MGYRQFVIYKNIERPEECKTNFMLIKCLEMVLNNNIFTKPFHYSINRFGPVCIGEFYPENIKLDEITAKEVFEITKSIDDDNIVIYDPNNNTTETFNSRELNVAEKICCKMLFPGATITEDKLVVAQSVVKKFESIIQSIEKLSKNFSKYESIIQSVEKLDKDVSKFDENKFNIFNDFRKNIGETIASVIEEQFYKYAKSHKTSFVRLKGQIAIISDFAEVVPFALSQYLVEKGIEIIIAPVFNTNEYYILVPEAFDLAFKTYRMVENAKTFDTHLEELKTLNDKMYNQTKLVKLIMLAMLSENVGKLKDRSDVIISEAEIDSVCRIIKKVFEGKYIYKLTNNKTDILIKDSNNELDIEDFDIEAYIKEDVQNEGICSPEEVVEKQMSDMS